MINLNDIKNLVALQNAAMSIVDICNTVIEIQKIPECIQNKEVTDSVGYLLDSQVDVLNDLLRT